MKNAVLNANELSQLRNVDRLLPSQPVLRKEFKEDDSRFFECLENVLMSVQPHRSVEEKWDIQLKPGVSYESLGSEIGSLYLYQLLIRLGGCKRILETGTYIGVSALYLAEAAGADGNVTTIEFGQEFHDMAKANFERNNYSDRITQIHGCAVEALAGFAEKKEKFDFIFIDAAKESYDKQFTSALECISPGGLILVDDVFFQGDALNPTPATEKGMGARRVLERAAEQKGFDKVVLPMGNGLLIVRASK